MRDALRSIHTPDVRIVVCEACGGEGRRYVISGCERETGYPLEHDCGPCPYCEGTGGEIIEVEPIEMEDLDA